MRRKNTRRTFIYWLVDVRPETIAAGWSAGQPFYCGKTVSDPEERLRTHKYIALHTERPVSSVIRECGDNIRIEIMEVVAPEKDWCERERHWIKILRFSFTNVTNVTDGGDGAPGNIHGAESRAKMSAALKGRTISPEWRAKISVGSRGNKNHQGKKLSSDRVAKLRAGHAAYYASLRENEQHA
jgi:hypothetical protein